MLEIPRTEIQHGNFNLQLQVMEQRMEIFHNQDQAILVNHRKVLEVQAKPLKAQEVMVAVEAVACSTPAILAY